MKIKQKKNYRTFSFTLREQIYNNGNKKKICAIKS